ncbi:MAG: helix-turn-helix domain-containing protein [Rhodospirillales bacterium]|nr:helix-turn-helix domain-containing protein [Rhodospirillales bacterium]
MFHVRPQVVERSATDTCAACSARPFSVCSAIDDKDMARLAAAAQTITVPAGRCFIEEGDSAEHFFNVTGGTAKLFKLLPDGRRQITGFAGVGHFLGLAVSATYAFGAEAVEPMRICRFARPRLRALLEDFPALEHRLLKVASNELVVAQEQMLLLGRKTARERLASFLVARAEAQALLPAFCAYGGGHASIVWLPMTRIDIADYLGLTIETVSRTFTRLRADKLIETPTPSEVVIRNHAGLERLATGSDQG